MTKKINEIIYIVRIEQRLNYTKNAVQCSQQFLHNRDNAHVVNEDKHKDTFLLTFFQFTNNKLYLSNTYH